MSDTEKITINLGGVDLGKIDLLVEGVGIIPTAQISSAPPSAHNWEERTNRSTTIRCTGFIRL